MIEQELLWACVWRFQMAVRGRLQELQKVPLTHLDHADRVVPYSAHLNNTRCQNETLPLA